MANLSDKQTGLQDVNTLTLNELAATPANPAASHKKFYAKNDGKIYTLDSSGNEVEVGAGSGGSLNLILNPDGSTDLDSGATDDIGDWIDSSTGTDSAKTTTAAEIALEDIKDTGIKITLAAGTNHYTRIRFQVPAALRNQNLSLSWDQRVSGLSAQDMKVELYNYSDNYVSNIAEVALFSDDTSGNTYIAANNGSFKTAFSANGREYYELRFINNGGTSGYLSLNTVTINNQGGANGAVIGPIYTQDLSSTDFTNDTGLTITGRMQMSRQGDYLNLTASIFFNGTGTDASEFQWNLPTYEGATILPAAGEYGGWFGVYRATDKQSLNGFLVGDGTNSRLAFSLQAAPASTQLGTAFGSGAASNDISEMIVSALIPITRWAGAGTVNLMDRGITTSNARIKHYKSSDSSVASATTIDFDTQEFLVGDITESAGSFTIGTTGYYKILGQVTFNAASSTGDPYINVNKNGAAILTQSYEPETSTDAMSIPFGDVFYLTAGDVITVTHVATGAITIIGNSLGSTRLAISREADHSAIAPVGFGTSDEADTSAKYLLPMVQESAEGDLGTITNWASPGSKKYRWTRTGNKIDFWWFITSNGGSSSSSATSFAFDIPSAVPQPINHLSNDFSGSFGILGATASIDGANYVKTFSGRSGTTYSFTASYSSASTIGYWGGHSTWMVNP